MWVRPTQESAEEREQESRHWSGGRGRNSNRAMPTCFLAYLWWQVRRGIRLPLEANGGDDPAAEGVRAVPGVPDGEHAEDTRDGGAGRGQAQASQPQRGGGEA